MVVFVLVNKHMMNVTLTEVQEILHSDGRINSSSRFGRFVVVTFVKCLLVKILLTVLLKRPAISSAARLKSDTKGKMITVWDLSLGLYLSSVHDAVTVKFVAHLLVTAMHSLFPSDFLVKKD